MAVIIKEAGILVIYKKPGSLGFIPHDSTVRSNKARVCSSHIVDVQRKGIEKWSVWTE